MRVYLKPLGLHSPAMTRVANALAAHAPPHITPVDKLSDIATADLVVLHLIDWPFTDSGAWVPSHYPHLSKPWQWPPQTQFAAIQYCLRTTRRPDPREWMDFWRQCALVWSYYDLSSYQQRGINVYHAPLGVNPATFYPPNDSTPREPFVITFGHVDGYPAEPISAVWQAASKAGLQALHIGSNSPANMTDKPPGWKSISNLTDDALAHLYRSASWVSGLRHIEGFELPAAEALSCGANAVLFDHPSQRHWYSVAGNAAQFVRDTPDYKALVAQLTRVLTSEPTPIPSLPALRYMFSWPRIVKGFWERVEQRLSN